MIRNRIIRNSVRNRIGIEIGNASYSILLLLLYIVVKEQIRHKLICFEVRSKGKLKLQSKDLKSAQKQEQDRGLTTCHTQKCSLNFLCVLVDQPSLDEERLYIRQQL